MFEALNKALTEAQEKDVEKIQKRKSKRMSAKLGLGPLDTEVNTGIVESEERREKMASIANVIDAMKAARISIESEIEEDDEDLMGACLLSSKDRPKWENNYIFTLYLIAFAVGGSNVWRFGFLCYRYGGIVFLIPYTFFSLVCALPCIYLELLVGQYAQVGVIAAWKIAPIFKGVGMCMVLLAFTTCFNMQAMLAWCIFYVFQASFYHPLPWISCDNGFAKKSNGQIDEAKEAWIPDEIDEEDHKNWHTENCTEFYADSGTGEVLKKHQRLPGSEFFRGRVQRMWKSGYEDKHSSNYHLDNGEVEFGFDSELGVLDYNLDTALCLFAVLIIILLCTFKGIKFSSNIMAVLTITPYVLLAVLLYRATGLNGAYTGLKELFKPDISKLFESETWWRCAEQVIYSTGTGFGIHLTFASHNSFTRKIVYDAIIVVVVNAVTSVLSACTIFMFLGHVNVAVNKDIKDLVRSGPELVFEVMPDVLGVLAKSNFYAFCFYLFLFLIVLTSASSTLVCAKTAYMEILPVSIKYKAGSRIMFVIIILTISFTISSLNLTRGGLHNYHFIECFSTLYSFAVTAFLFLIGITWFFGISFYCPSKASLKQKIRAPGLYFQVCWKFVSPIVFAVVFFGLVFDPDSHHVIFNGRIIPLDISLMVFGLTISLGPIVTLFVLAIFVYWNAPGKNFKQKMLTCISPTSEHKEILATGTGKRAKLSHYFYIYAPPPGKKCNVCCYLNRKKKVHPEGKLTADGEIPLIEVSLDEQKINSANLVASQELPITVEGNTGEVKENVTEQRKASNPEPPPPPPATQKKSFSFF